MEMVEGQRLPADWPPELCAMYTVAARKLERDRAAELREKVEAWAELDRAVHDALPPYLGRMVRLHHTWPIEDDDGVHVIGLEVMPGIEVGLCFTMSQGKWRTTPWPRVGVMYAVTRGIDTPRLGWGWTNALDDALALAVEMYHDRDEPRPPAVASNASPDHMTTAALAEFVRSIVQTEVSGLLRIVA